MGDSLQAGRSFIAQEPWPSPSGGRGMASAASLFFLHTDLPGSVCSVSFQGPWKEEPCGVETSSGVRGVELLSLQVKV